MTTRSRVYGTKKLTVSKIFEGELAARKARVWGVNPVWVQQVRVNPVWVQQVRVWGVDPHLSVSIEVLSVCLGKVKGKAV
jgi:predicted metallopeptidase